MKHENIAIYIRESTLHEEQIKAMKNQIQECREKVQNQEEWKIVNTYIDAGKSGTTIEKRPAFKNMMEDAENGKMDLVVVRDVSRFSRNLADILNATRRLRNAGVEVWFTSENFWTIEDDDIEFKLSIYGLFAQSESLKISERSKLGQAAARNSGVLFGNGNILGYDRIGKEYVVNEEQAETVKLIYDMYLCGRSIRDIADELTRQGRKTSQGKLEWDRATVGRILSNPFYCGTIVYLKEIVVDPLQHTRVKNTDETIQVIKEGTHEPLVSKEDFLKVQEIKQKNSNNVDGKNKNGKKEADRIWNTVIKCHCGHKMGRKKYNHGSAENENKQYAYKCSYAHEQGTKDNRIKRGLDPNLTCDTKMVAEWKLDLLISIISQCFIVDRQAVLSMASRLIGNNLCAGEIDDVKREIEENKKKDKKLQDNINKLIKMKIDEKITEESYQSIKYGYENDQARCRERIAELESIDCQEMEEMRKNREQELKMSLLEMFSPDSYDIPDAIIKLFVEEVYVESGNVLVFTLRMPNGKAYKYACTVENRQKNPEISIKQCA